MASFLLHPFLWLGAIAGLPLPEGAPRGAAELVRNEGQWPDRVAFATPDGSFWLTADGFRIRTRRDDGGWCLGFSFAPAEGESRWRGEDATAARRNWFRGADPDGWVRGVRSFRAARWPALAPGIDLVVRSVGGRPRYDLELDAGADPSAVVVRVDGATGLALDERGALVVETPLGDLVQSPPLAWDADGRSRSVRFALLDDRHFTFVAAGGPGTARWTIDPVLVWSGFLGGSFEEEIVAIERLSNGDLVVAGPCLSDDFPVTFGALLPFYQGGFSDGFVSRLSADATTLLGSTYVGGTDLDWVQDAAVGPGDTITLTGYTRSPDFPTQGGFGDSFGGQRDLFALRLNAAADTLIWSGYVGGAFDDRGNAVAVAADGGAVVVGGSNGLFPTTGAVVQSAFKGGLFAGDAVALRIRADGSDVEWATYLGSSGDDTATQVHVAASGEVTVVGLAGGGSMPTTFGSFDNTFNGQEDGFVLRLAADASQLVWGTFFGGSGSDGVLGLDVDTTGRVAICGASDSLDLPTTAGAPQPANAGGDDGFVARLSADGQSLEVATYVGGEDEDEAQEVRFESGDALAVVGNTRSLGYPVSPGSFQPDLDDTNGNLSDAFVTRLDAAGASFDYSTYLGGAENDRALALAVLAPGELLVVGQTRSFDFPRLGTTYQSVYNGSSQGMGFLTRINLFAQPVEFGAGKPSSLGYPPRIRWLGFPSLTDADLQVGLDSGIAGQPSVIFEGTGSAAFPWLGGTLWVQPPLRRLGTVVNDFVGFGAVPVPISSDMIGTTRYFQVWTRDPADPFGAVMTPGLQVRIYP